MELQQQTEIDIHTYSQEKAFRDDQTIAHDLNIHELAKILCKLLIFKKDFYTLDLVLHRPLSMDTFILRLEFKFNLPKARLLKYCKPLFDLLKSMNEMKKAQIH